MVQYHQTVPDRWLGEHMILQPLIAHHQPRAVPIKQLQPIRAFRAEHKHRAGERIFVQLIHHQCAKPVMAPAEVDRLGRHHNPHAIRRENHLLPFRASTICAMRPASVYASSRKVTRPVAISIVAILDGEGSGASSTTNGANPISSGTADKASLPY